MQGDAMTAGYTLDGGGVEVPPAPKTFQQPRNQLEELCLEWLDYNDLLPQDIELVGQMLATMQVSVGEANALLVNPLLINHKHATHLGYFVSMAYNATNDEVIVY